MTDEHDPQPTKRFPTSLRGYSTSEVDAHVTELEARIETIEAERDDLEREAARLRGELDATRAALPELESLHQRLEEVREEYGRRVHALELLMAAAAREAGERLAKGPSNGGSPAEPAPEEVRETLDDTDEIPSVAGSQAPDVVRGSWALPQTDDEDT